MNSILEIFLPNCLVREIQDFLADHSRIYWINHYSQMIMGWQSKIPYPVFIPSGNYIRPSHIVINNQYIWEADNFANNLSETRIQLFSTHEAWIKSFSHIDMHKNKENRDYIANPANQYHLLLRKNEDIIHRRVLKFLNKE